ncbi:MAG: hypothetical protein Q7T25_12165 [Sideroxyarcus sp.]|nr:hypothetical protein [Sideroxyarcus sp.]
MLVEGGQSITKRRSFIINKQLTTLLLTIAGWAVIPAAHAESASINTRSGNEFGLSISSYSYEEPSVNVSLTGDKFGMSYTGTAVLKNDWFVREELRFAYGKVDYSGSGVQLGVPDWYYEVRGLLGKDLQVRNVAYSPYIGFGYRYLFNDVRGYSNAGSAGYRRESSYFYLPLGVTHHLEMRDQAVLSTTLEFDYFLRGKQVTRLSDLIGRNGFTSAFDTTNRQNSGSGYRLNVMYEMSDWAFGPFLNVWKIDTSEVTTQVMTDGSGPRLVKLYEPQNQTSEYGFRVNHRF